MGDGSGGGGGGGGGVCLCWGGGGSCMSCLAYLPCSHFFELGPRGGLVGSGEGTERSSIILGPTAVPVVPSWFPPSFLFFLHACVRTTSLSMNSATV